MSTRNELLEQVAREHKAVSVVLLVFRENDCEVAFAGRNDVNPNNLPEALRDLADKMEANPMTNPRHN